MGMDYEYQLYFERDALVDVLERIGTMADPTGVPTTLVLPDRTLTLPYSTWADTPSELRWDDPAPRWEFATSLWFEPDGPIRDYLEPRTAGDPPADSYYDDSGRARIGYVYLTVHRDLTASSGGADDTGGDLVEFSFGTPGSSMSVLFLESESIRRTFAGLLESSRGVYGVFDREDPATLFWWRGRELDEELPTAEMTLAQIEEHAGLTREAVPLPLTFQADEVCATARHLRRSTGGTDLGTHHWLLALLGTDPGLGLDLSAVLGFADRSLVSAELRRRLERGDVGVVLAEDQAQAGAASRARRRGADRVAFRDLAETVVAAAPGAVLLPEVTGATAAEPSDERAESRSYPEPSFWTPRNSTCDPWWRRTLDRVLMGLPSNSGAPLTVPVLVGAVLTTVAVLAVLLTVLALLL